MEEAMISISHNRGGGPELRILIVAALCIVVFLPRTASADTATAQLQAAAEKGYVSRQIDLAAAYFIGKGVPQNLRLAAYWYEKAAENGDADAQNEIGFLYQTGTGVPADAGRALHWYQLASAGGCVAAKVNLGVMYYWGTGVRKDPALAAEQFREAAKQGSGTAAAYLGVMQYFGSGVAQDRAAAQEWFAVGAKLHDPLAAFNLASLFTGRDGHTLNLPKAAELLRSSSGRGYVPAMHALGRLLASHPELAESSHEAEDVIAHGSNAGYWKSSVLLAIFERDGKNAAADPAAAFYHFQLAVLKGGEPVKELVGNDLTALSAQLKPDQVAELTNKAAARHGAHPFELQVVYVDTERAKRFPASARVAALNDSHAGQLVLPPPA
jgi:TPR repeat protein